jgi:hypothetical protein
MSFRFSLAALALALISMSMHHVLATSVEIELDSESGKLEVAVFFTPRDLEAALTAANGRAIRLDKEDKLEQLLETYLDANFDLLLADGSTATFLWVGQESELRDFWVYFELDAQGSLKGCSIQNTLLAGLGAEYISTVTMAKAGGGKRSLRFDGHQKKLQLDETQGVGDDHPAESSSITHPESVGAAR